MNTRHALLGLILALIPGAGVLAGGGLVLRDDVCIIEIDFYSAHFTAFQPNSSGNTQFCRSVPDTGATIFVLDYLHQSLKEVPVSFRIIRDVTGQGRFAKLKHLAEIEDIEQHSVFYQPPVVRADASFKIEHDFSEEGVYLVVVTAGHPRNDTIYTAVFPFEVGASDSSWLAPLILLLGVAVFLLARRLNRPEKRAPGQGAAK